MKSIILAMLSITLLVTTPLVSTSEVAHHGEHEHRETERFRNIPQSWCEAARSWRMTIDQYLEEADKILDNTSEGSATTERKYEDLMPVFNPYANLDPQIVTMLKGSFGSEEEYQRNLDELEKNHPKFTIAR